MFLVKIESLFFLTYSLNNLVNFCIALVLKKLSQIILPPRFSSLSTSARLLLPILNIVCDKSCAERTHVYLHSVQFDLREFQYFCFQCSSCLSFARHNSIVNMNLTIAQDFLLAKNFQFLFLRTSFICRKCRNSIPSFLFLIIFTK